MHLLLLCIIITYLKNNSSHHSVLMINKYDNSEYIENIRISKKGPARNLFPERNYCGKLFYYNYTKMMMITAVISLILLQFSCIGAKNLEEITNKVYFDVEIGGKAAGRIVMGLFGNGIY